MAKRSVIGGKVMRTPSLERYDGRLPQREDAAEPVGADHAGYKEAFFLDKDAPRTWKRDKALLVALGVNGEVPLEEARVNAGLDGPDARVREWRKGLRPPRGRGSGTTGEQLLGLEDGDAFVVAHGDMARYTLELLRYLRGPEVARSIKIAVASTAHEQLLGRRGRVIVDHALIDLVSRDTYWRVLEVAGAVNARWRPANDNHKIAAVAA